MRTVIGIDIGGSTTKIVGIRTNEKGIETLIEPIFVTATDALTSVYGAFGKFTMQNGIELSQIDRVLMTGVGSSFIDKPIYGLECTKVSEFVSVGLGGLYQSGLDEAIVVSMGTGTALIYAKRKKDGELAKVKYLGGTGVGGGTLVGLSRKILGVSPAAPGFSKITFAPDLCQLEYASGTIPTPHGEISVKLQKGAEPEITLPPQVEIVK